MTMPPREEVVAFSHAMMVLLAVAAGAGALTLALATKDPVMSFHALLFFAFCAAAGYYVATNPRPGGAREQDSYMDGPIKVATVAAVFWGVVGFLIGDIIAWQLAFPALNLDLPWTNFGRLRPVHTSAVIFAFGGNVLIGDVVLRRAAHLPGAPRRRLGAVVRRSGATSCSSCWRRRAT